MFLDKRPHDTTTNKVAAELTSSKEKILEVWSTIPKNWRCERIIETERVCGLCSG